MKDKNKENEISNEEEKAQVVDECECEDCGCEEHCGCQEGQECTCGDDCRCGEECHCKEHGECEEHCECEHGEGEHKHHKMHKHHHEHECCGHCECEHEEDDCCNQEAGQYLQMAQRLQADFDNYRKRVAEQLDLQREEGKRSVIEVFLPCLDTFKEAKKSIVDENVLSGVNMIENKIVGALKTLGVEKTPSVGQKYDHNLHEVLAVLRDESKENDIILDEYQAGYTMNGKVIRYSKVVVNKLD